MPGYILAHLDLRDLEAFAAYRREVVPLLAEFGGETIINTNQATVYEGPQSDRQIVVVRFPSVEKAKAFLECDAYEPLRQMRMKAALSDVVIVDGFVPSAAMA